MKCSLRNSWRENSLNAKNGFNPSQNFQSTFLSHLRQTVSQKTVRWRWTRGGQTFVISTDLLHRRRTANVGGNGSSLIRASLQYIWLPVCHTAGLNEPRNIIHRYVTGYAHKSLRLADFLQGRMERDACNAFHCRRQPWRVQLQSHPIWRLLRAFDAYLFKGLRSCPVYAAWFIQTMTHVSDGVTGQNIGQKKT